MLIRREWTRRDWLSSFFLICRVYEWHFLHFHFSSTRLMLPHPSSLSLLHRVSSSLVCLWLIEIHPGDSFNVSTSSCLSRSFALSLLFGVIQERKSFFLSVFHFILHKFHKRQLYSTSQQRANISTSAFVASTWVDTIQSFRRQLINRCRTIPTISPSVLPTRALSLQLVTVSFLVDNRVVFSNID